VVRRSLELGGAPEPGWLESSSGLSNKAQRLKQMARKAGLNLDEWRA